MIDKDSLQALNKALKVRAQAGHEVVFWLRDDDAIAPSQPLDRLLAITNRYSIPLTLAVIPAETDHALVERLDSTRMVSVAVHGWSHRNHAPATQKKQELGSHRHPDTVVAELRLGFSQLAALHASRFVALLVPPWNRIDTAIVEQLTAIGFQGLSTFADGVQGPIRMLNTHLDIIDWKGTRGGRDPARLVAELIELLEAGTQPIGILTHHLVHDDQAWQFLEALFEATASHQDVTWASAEQLLSQLPPVA